MSRLTNPKAAGEWLRNTMAADDYTPLSKSELSKLALKSNPKGYTAKEIAKDTRRRGKICPVNPAGPYIAEGLNSTRNGGLEFVREEDGTFHL